MHNEILFCFFLRAPYNVHVVQRITTTQLLAMMNCGSNLNKISLIKKGKSSLKKKKEGKLF